MELNYKKIELIASSKKEKGKFKQKEKLVLPKNFSYSQIIAFRKCPLQYKFAYILKIPVRGKGTFSFGKSIHLTIEKFSNLFLERQNKYQKNLFGGKKVKDKKIISFEELLKIYKKEWIDDWYEDKTQKERYLKEGKKILKLFYEDFFKNPPRIANLNGKNAVEIGFKLELEGNILSGKIDRIDQLEDGVRIIDYKTGENVPKKIDWEKKMQLLIYQIAAEDFFRVKPIELTYHYLKENKKLSFLGSEEEKEKVISLILKEINKIKEKNFQPTPGWNCKSCDFKEICPYAKN